MAALHLFAKLLKFLLALCSSFCDMLSLAGGWGLILTIALCLFVCLFVCFEIISSVNRSKGWPGTLLRNNQKRVSKDPFREGFCDRLSLAIEGIHFNSRQMESRHILFHVRWSAVKAVCVNASAGPL